MRGVRFFGENEFMRVFLIFGLCGLAASLTPVSAVAEGARGAAFYAIMSDHWDCDASLHFFDHRDEKALAFVWKTFGDSTACLQRFFALPGNKFVVVHPFNEACRWKEKCNAFEIEPRLGVAEFRRAVRSRDPKVLEALQARVHEIRAFLEPYCRRPGVECAMSTGLEHRFDAKEEAIVLSALRREWPFKTVSNALVDEGRAAPRVDYAEEHSVTPDFHGRACVTNLDGHDPLLPIAGRRQWQAAEGTTPAQLREHFEIWPNRCRAAFAWTHEFNCKDEGDGWRDPRSRTNCPNAAVISAVNEILLGLP